MATSTACRTRWCSKSWNVRSTPTTVEIFHHGNRVASHARSRGREQAVTIHEHRPKSHQVHLEWPPSRMVNWARTIGPHTAELFERILSEKPHPEMGYRSCLGIIRLAQQYSAQRMESRRGAGHSRSYLPLSEREVDSEELARCGSLISAATRFSSIHA
jgi:hypothetical protein